jgi:hypothetical protein
VLLKDNVNTNDMPNTGGSLSLAGYTPVSDAVITRRLRSAGAIILAKVNLHEFAIWVKRHCLRVQLATGYGQEGVTVVEPFRIHVADEVLNDLRARLRNARWPDQIPGIGWEQGTELDW